jgi:hypothetical protein
MSLYSFICAFEVFSLHCDIVKMKFLCMLRVHTLIFSYFIVFLFDGFDLFYYIPLHCAWLLYQHCSEYIEILIKDKYI